MGDRIRDDDATTPRARPARADGVIASGFLVALLLGGGLSVLTARIVDRHVESWALVMIICFAAALAPIVLFAVCVRTLTPTGPPDVNSQRHHRQRRGWS
jgi:hypothetical protein